MTSVFSWQNSISLCPVSFCTPRPKLVCYSRYLLTSYFCIPVLYDEKEIFFLLTVLEGLVSYRCFRGQLFLYLLFTKPNPECWASSGNNVSII